MNISLREIEYILTIAEEGNITKAANRLFIAQPSLSQAVKKVEADLGMPLFSRVKGGLTLTEAGRYFVDAGQRITGIATEMDAAIADLSTLHTGTLNLGTPYHLGSYVVPDLLAVFKKEHPSVRVNLREGTSDELETMICDGLIEAAIMPLPFKQTCISYLPFFTSRMVLVMSKDDPLNRFAYSGSPTDQFPTFDLRNAASAPFLIGMKGQRIRTVTEIVFRRAGIVPNIVMRSQNVETIRRMAGLGYGLAIMPEHYLFHQEVSDSIQYYYLPPEQDYEWTIVLAYYQQAQLSQPVQGLINVMNRSPRKNLNH